MKTCYSCLKSFFIPNETYTESVLMCRPTEESPIQEANNTCPDYSGEERCVTHDDGASS